MNIKNVIVINDYDYSQGGASKVAIDTANIIASFGLSVTFFSVVHKDNGGLSPDVKLITLAEPDALSNPNRIKGMLSGIKNTNCLEELANLLDSVKPVETIVHIHGWTKACSSGVFKLLRARGFTTVLTLHEYFSICATGALYDFNLKERCTEKCGSLRCLLKNCDSRNYLFKLYRSVRELRYYRDMQFESLNCIFVSEYQRDIICQYKNPAHMTVIQNPSDMIGLQANGNKEFDYVYIGRTTEEKGIDYFIRLANELATKSFLLVGEYDKTIPSNVKVTGWVTEKDVRKWLIKSRVLVFPSLWPETYGLNVIIALGYGIPCLVASNTAAEKYIGNKNGLIFEQGNYNDFRKKAIEVLTLKPMPDDRLLMDKNEYGRELINFYENSIQRSERKE